MITDKEMRAYAMKVYEQLDENKFWKVFFIFSLIDWDTAVRLITHEQVENVKKMVKQTMEENDDYR